MNFLDKYWEVAQKISNRASRAEFIVSCVEYYYTGDEPQFKNEIADVAFEGVKNLIDTSRRQSELGKRTRKPSSSRKAANGEPNANQTPTNYEPNANQTTNQTANQTANQTLTLEQEQVTSKETPPSGGAKKATSRFRPPTVDEVREYASEKGLGIDPDRFCDFYESKGWKVGRNPMKDWKAAARGWDSRERRSDGFDKSGLGAYADAW